MQIEFKLSPVKSRASGDCVTRALTYITGKPYETIYRLMLLYLRTTGARHTPKTGIVTQQEDFQECMAVMKFRYVTHFCVNLETFLLQSPEFFDAPTIVHVEHHWTVCHKNAIIDAWDCRKRRMLGYYQKI